MYAHTQACTNNYEDNFNNVAEILKRETFLPSMTDTQSCGKQADFKKKEKMRLAMSLYTSPMFLHHVALSENKLDTTLFNKDTFVPCVLRSQDKVRKTDHSASC